MSATLSTGWPSVVDTFEADWRTGMNVGDIARRYGYSKDTVGGALARRGINTRECRAKRAFTHEETETIVLLYQAGIGCRALGQLFRCSPDPVKRVLLERGVLVPNGVGVRARS